MLQLYLGLQLLGQFPWLRVCWELRQCWNSQLTSGMAVQIQPGQAAGEGHRDLLAREFVWLKYAGTSARS